MAMRTTHIYPAAEPHIESEHCRCKPEMMEHCWECETGDKECWKCGGRGLVPATFGQDDVVFVHQTKLTDSETVWIRSHYEPEC